MQLTVIPKRPTCTARVLVRCTREVLRAPPLRFPAFRALVPLILMMRPHFCSFMKGIAARAQRSAPTYLMLKSCSRSSSTTVSMGPVAVAEPPGAEPLLTRMCNPPSSAAACATIASTCALLATSAAIAMTRPLVSSASSRAAVSSLSFVRATMATSAPSRASSRAIALPMARLPPVTIARLPRSPRSIALLPLIELCHYTGTVSDSTHSMGRRLAAILAADIAGYSLLMGEDEAATVRDLKGHQAVVLPLVGRHGGRIIDTAGDGILAEFPSVIGATECAIEIQAVMAARNADVPEPRRMRFRIGINLGDVIHDETRIYGDGINVAARLEALAAPGGVLVSHAVHEQVRDRLALA